MLDRMLEENAGLREALRSEGGLREADLVFVKELIVGPLTEDGMPDRSREAQEAAGPESRRWPYRGRTESKSFLYEIVANKISGEGEGGGTGWFRSPYYAALP